MAFRLVLPKLLSIFSSQNLRSVSSPRSAQHLPLHSFHTSQPRPAFPAVVIILMRPVMKISAMLFGRTIRKRWEKLPPDKRQAILSKVRGKMTYIAAGSTVLAGLAGLFWLEHIEQDPITGRKRFILYNDEQMKEIAEMAFESEVSEHRGNIIPPSHPIYRRITRVANRILQANNTLPQVRNKEWAVTVVDRPDVTNAFVLPNGKIFVFTGILHVASNDDQLAVVLSHEMSHALLEHIRENLSKTFYIDIILLVPLVVIWAIFPDVAALFSQWLTSRIADVMFHLPFSRALEKEADVVGLKLAASACYDVREAPVFWGKMRQVELNNQAEPLEWLSTHPNNETRQTELSHLVPAAIEVREKCHCPLLPPLSRAQRQFYVPRLQ